MLFLFWNNSASGFIISDIRLEGLQRVSAGTVFGAISYSIGDNVGALELQGIARSIFKTESFDDVQIGRDGNVLVVVLKERPSIDSIEFEGNKAIKTEALLEGLQGSGLSEGQIFKKVTLDQIASDLERQYVSQGRYDASVEATVEELTRNRVAIKVDIYEGSVSGLKHINIIGNLAFPDEELLDLLELRIPKFFAFFSKDDQYSREKFQSDIEALESFYLDRGYLDFRIDSTQVSVAPNMEDVYITINLEEGEVYSVSGVEIAGELRDIPESSIRALILGAEDKVFSRRLMTSSEERIEAALGNAGYTFASAKGEPVQDEEDNSVTIKYFVDAGKRAYVRRVNFSGNTVTQDHVLRREMRQMENGWASTAMIEGSKIRLQRLGFFKEVNVETPAVLGMEDQIDVNFTVEEQPSGSISATVGYAENRGLILGLGYQESNVFGTGNSINIGVNRSDFQTSLSLSFFDPYFTVDGVSRGYSISYRKSDFEDFNVASFSTDSIGANVSFGYPISEISRINFNIGFENTQIEEGIIPAREISEFLDREGSEFNLITLQASYRMSALNRGLLPTGGRSQSISFDMTIPGSELEFYRINYNGQIFFPLFDPFVLRLRTDLGYGGTYGDTQTFPFYKHFFAGGMGSVRGFDGNSLGPRSTPSPQDRFNDPDPIGGNVLIEMSAEILFPLPFVDDQTQMRSVLFFDAGNVFNTNCPQVSVYCLDIDEGELRYSAGIAFTWITGFAPLSFSLSFPINEKEGDEKESFQFELGKSF
ncbi:MAG: outer membrane protein assembly factor BamA [Candidatus Azotimanducaceae bacterium]